MKQIFLLITCLLISTWSFAQCQLCYLNEAQAQKVTNFLKLKPEVVLYAGCAHEDIARRLRIENVIAQPVKEKPGYFSIFISGTIIGTFTVDNQRVQNYVETEMRFAEMIDIAYVHIRTGGFTDEDTGKSVWDATCLGIYLGYDCDPCVDPFDYPYLSAEGY